MEIALGLLFLILVLALIYSFAQGATFVPSAPAKVEFMIKLLAVKSGELAADLGSGDGRIVIALAEAGAIAHGYEINPLLVWWSRRNISQAGLQRRAFIHLKSFWGKDLAAFDVVVVYGIGYIMKKLGQKLKRELKPGARVVSFAFPLPGWQEEKKEAGVYLYIKPH